MWASRKKVDNAYGVVTRDNGSHYYECRLCDKVVKKSEKDIVRHVFRHIWGQSVPTTDPLTPRQQPAATSGDSRAVSNGQKSTPSRQPVPKPVASSSFPFLDQLNDRGKAKLDLFIKDINRQSKSLRTNNAVITGRLPARTRDQPLPKRAANDQTVRTVAKQPKTTTQKRVQSSSQTKSHTTVRSTAQTSSQSSAAATTSQRRQHSQQKPANRTAANLNTMALKILKRVKNPTPFPNSTAPVHDWTYCPISGYQRMGDKWFKVEKRDDRQVNRHRKESFTHDRNYKGLFSLKNMKQWYRTVGVPSDPNRTFHCLYKLSNRKVCPWSTKISQEMARHLHVTHIGDRRFVCRYPRCGQVYRDPKSKRTHELNHRCGFGTGRGKTMATACGNRNIQRFRRPLVESGVKRFQCTLCDKITRTYVTLKRHLHNQHLCPYRLRFIECSPPPGAVQDSGISSNDSERSSSTLTTDAVHEFTANNDSDDDFELQAILADPIVQAIAAQPIVQEITAEPILQAIVSNSRGEAIVDDSEVEVIATNSGVQAIAVKPEVFTIDDSDSDDDLKVIEVIPLIAGHQRRRLSSRVSPEFKELLRTKNVKTCSKARIGECREQLDRLARIRPHFDRRVIDGFESYVCKRCQFSTRDLKAISIHLKWIHNC